nr:sugar transferase [Dolosigranulum pigrum]
MMSNTGGFDRTKKMIILISDVLLYHVSIYLAFFLRYQGDLPYNYLAYEKTRIYIFISFIILNILLGIYVMYNKRKTDLILLTLIIQLIMSVLIMAMTFFGRLFTFPRTVILISLITSTIILSFWRIVIFKLYLKLSGSKKVVVIGDEEQCRQVVQNFAMAKNNRHVIEAMITGHVQEHIEQLIESIDIIYLVDNSRPELTGDLYRLALMHDKKLFLPTTFETLKMVSANVMTIEDESILELSMFHISPEDDLLKRAGDILISVMLLILASPIMLVTALLIKATSKGPVFYKQTRITLDQREFSILKFRTMSATAEKDSGPVLAQANDSRVTTVGKYLRSLRIDELPQLINVLRGDMSLVGPRPERPFFVEQFKEENPYYELRHNVRAGITGYAQVYGKYSTDFQAKLKFDLVYIKNYSLLFDIQILLQTIKILFDKVSSKGVDEVSELGNTLPDSIDIYK